MQKHVGFFAVLAALAVGCGTDSDNAAVEDNNQAGNLTWEEFLSVVYQEPDTGVFIADGDTPFPTIEHLREFYESLSTPTHSAPLIIHRSGGVDARWSSSQQRNITYCVSRSGFGTRYNTVVTAMNNAAAAWEGVCGVNFVHVSAQDGNCTSTNSAVIFDVRPTTSTQYAARAFFPNQSRSSRNVLIASSAYSQLTGILRHELGHTLGFRHEHTRPESGRCFEDNNWRVLTPYDRGSCMHYPSCGGTNSALVISGSDATGCRAVYGS